MEWMHFGNRDLKLYYENFDTSKSIALKMMP